MQQIAKQFGVAQNTISRDLEGLSVMDKPPRPKGGRPKGSTKPKPAHHEGIVSLADQGLSSTEIAAEVKIGSRMVDRDLGDITHRW